MRRKPGYRFRTILSAVFIILLWLSALSYITWFLFRTAPAEVPVQSAVAAVSEADDDGHALREAGEVSPPVSVHGEVRPTDPIQEEVRPTAPIQEEVNSPVITSEVIPVYSEKPVLETSSQVTIVSSGETHETVPEEGVTEIPHSEPAVIRVPDEPIMFEPFVMEMMDEDTLFLPPVTPVYDDDFFADFFVSGSDTLTIEDGIYYYRLYADT